VRDLILPMAEQKGLALTFDMPEPDRRLGHPRALSRVLLNLATNGLKATDQGSVQITATQGCDHRVTFSVADTGPGLDEESLRSLYQPWRRRAATRSQFSGTGLGLAICRKLVGGMGSELQVESAVGIGTRFYFELDLPPSVS
jgi:signal transduction histidine kinase